MSTTVPVSDERLFDVMYHCRAIRRFTKEPVPEELLVQLVDAALHGPSASNAQNWAFVIVRDVAQKRLLKAVWQRAWAFYRASVGASLLRPGEDPASRERVLRGADDLVDHLEDVPALIFVGVLRDADAERRLLSPGILVKYLGIGGATRFLGSGQKIGALAKGSTAYPAVQNMLLAARALGLGAVMTTQHFFVPGEFEKVLGLPKSFTLAAIVPVGWPAERFGPTRRPEPRSVISWDRWGPAHE
ncbi:MAG: nitroreductase family protein [Kineosporiaceae bacterium]|jgi:nitroreductase